MRKIIFNLVCIILLVDLATFWTLIVLIVTIDFPYVSVNVTLWIIFYEALYISDVKMCAFNRITTDLLKANIFKSSHTVSLYLVFVLSHQLKRLFFYVSTMFTLQILHDPRENSYYFIWRSSTPWKFQSFSLPFQVDISVNHPPEVYGYFPEQYISHSTIPKDDGLAKTQPRPRLEW